MTKIEQLIQIVKEAVEGRYFYIDTNNLCIQIYSKPVTCGNHDHEKFGKKIMTKLGPDFTLKLTCSSSTRQINTVETRHVVLVKHNTIRKIPMNITRKNAIAIFTDLGFPTANKWDTVRTEQKLKKLPELLQSTDISNAELAATAKEITKAIKAGDTITISEDKPEQKASAKESSAKGEKAVKTKPEKEVPEKETKAKKASTKPEVTETEEPPVNSKKEKPSVPKDKSTQGDVKRDKFGQKEGTGASAINTCITKKPKDIDTLITESGQNKTRVRAHLKYLIEKKLIQETAGKYSQV